MNRRLIGALGLALASASSASAQTAPTPTPTPAEIPLYAIVYAAGPNWRTGVPMEQQGMLPHLRYVRELHARGVIVLAGPRGPTGGLAVIRARSQDEASAVVANDPAVRAGLLVGDAAPFTPAFVSDRPFPAPPAR